MTLLRNLPVAWKLALGAGTIRQRRSHWVGGFHQAAAGLVDVPLAVRLAGDAARPFGLVDGGVADAEATGGLAGRGGQLGQLSQGPGVAP